MPGPCMALKLYFPAGCLNRWCAAGTPYVWHWGLKSHRTVRTWREGRDGFSLWLLVTNRGSSTRLCWGGRLSLQTDALRQEAPGLFLALPRVALLLFLGAYGLQDYFSCCLSLPSLSPLTWVNNGVNEAGGGRFACCTAAHSRCGGKYVYESVGCRVQRCHLRSTGVLPPASLSVSIMNSLAPLCDLFLEVTCSMGC